MDDLLDLTGVCLAYLGALYLAGFGIGYLVGLWAGIVEPEHRE